MKFSSVPSEIYPYLVCLFQNLLYCVTCVILLHYLKCLFSLSNMSQEDKEMEEAVKKVGGNPQYKVLTKEEYDILMAGTALRASTTKQPIPLHGPKLTLQPRTPGAIGASRLRHIYSVTHNRSSFSAAPVYNPPQASILQWRGRTQ